MYLLFSFYFFILFWIVNFIGRYLKTISFITFPVFWLSFEFLQNFSELRFPWFNAAYSLADYLLLIQVADIGGIYLLSLLILTLNYLIYRSYKNRTFLYLVLLLVLVWFGYGFFRLKTIKLIETNSKVAVLQGNIEQDMKWEPEYREKAIDIYSDFSRECAKEGVSLSIWPESAITAPVLVVRNYERMMKSLAAETNSSLLVGFPHIVPAPENHPEDYLYYNSCTQFSPDGKVGIPYYKNLLVPFGERIPLLNLFPFLWKIQLGQANFEYGKDVAIYQVDSLKYSPLICFEIAFPLQFNRIVSEGADFIVNITNDAWFKKTSGTYQHAVLAKFRAVENRIQIFRAANTGISLVVSPTGKVLNEIKVYERDYQYCNVIRHEGKTLYFLAGKYLPWVNIAIGILILLWSICYPRKKQCGHIS